MTGDADCKLAIAANIAGPDMTIFWSYYPSLGFSI